MTDNDTEIETAAAVIEDLLYLVPPDKRAAVLVRAAEVEAKERADRQKHGRWRIWSADEMADSMNAPGMRYWNRVMRFKARLIYTFTRNITNNYSAEDAAKLLISQQPSCPGSGCLAEYIDDLPRRPKKQL